MNKTVIYYTANRENEVFEQKIRDGIAKCGLPIISVSQRPIDLGTNICVGDVGHSYLNAFRQLLIGCKVATTEYVVMAEADCLYPATGYFDYKPSNPDPETIYTYDNVWVLWKDKGPFRHKPQTHASIIYNREFLINLLEDSLKGLPEWSREKVGFPFYTDKHKFEHFTGDAIISLKTGDGIQKGTRTDDKINELPYWGTAEELRGKIWTN